MCVNVWGMGIYRKVPIEIIAEQWMGGEQCPPAPFKYLRVKERRWFFFRIPVDDWVWELKTLEGWYKLTPLDWIIQGVEGEFYPCKPGIFAKTYEAVEE